MRDPARIRKVCDALEEADQNTLREQARISLEMEEPWALTQLRECREERDRLRKIARCFDRSDKTILVEILDFFQFDGEPMSGVYAACINRMIEAAKLAEDAPRQPVIVPRDGDVDLLRELFVLSSLGEYEKFEDLEAWQKRQVRANRLCSRYIDQIEGETPNERQNEL